MFMALGLLLPILFHTLGLGKMFLPMYWPIIGGAFFLSLPYAIAIAVFTPFMSSILTGMPPMAPPVMQIVVVELTFMVLIINVLHRATKLGALFILLIVLLISRIVLIFLLRILAPYLGLPPALLSWSAVLASLPGLTLIVILISLLITRFKREPLFLKK